ncbi:Sphingoid long chain base kinase 5 [Cytospora mali]|uniref:Sphingoid long chain base kinase 5 n=1 Tax=Cytospora mali TaxID=578113 RepID=A0A194VHH4_CYTMA|nr:Sphingoid long chain base kinase 5 [Valsa mali]
MPQQPSAAPEVQAGYLGPHYTIDLGRNVSLSIEDDSVFIQDGKADKSNKKNNRTCGFGSSGSSQSPTTRSIPLYDILWAELFEDRHTLTIEYAEELSKTRRRAAKLSFSTVATNPSSEDDGQRLYSSPSNITRWIDRLMNRSYGPASRRKRAYVLVNPHAGPGGAVKIWEEQVKPIFEAARMPMTIHETTFSGEAVDLAEKMDIDAFDIVVPCSGDGLPHEVFNGLGRRPDARRALQKIAVAHIPCGSGNALACNVFGTHRPSLAALAVVKGVATPMDLISITQGDRRKLSFLSQALGIIAEADLATEHLRWMGEHRFTYGVAMRILKKRVYPCDLYVKVDIDHKQGVREHYRRERENSSVVELDKMTTSTGTRTHVGRDSSVADSEEAASSEHGAGLPPLKYGTVNDKLPAGWEKIDADNVGNFYCGNVAYMAPDVIFFNAAWINDGYMDLITVDGNVPTAKAPGLMLSVSNNSFFDNSLVTYRKVSAFRIIPKNQEDGYISIDGEKVPFEPFQAEVHQGLGMVITKRGLMEAPGPRNWDKVSMSERLMA